MKRPWQVWLVFLVCVALGAAAMVWLTQQSLQADELRRAAEAETELEQRVSLALWRMDTELAPLVAEEVIRPPSAYAPPYVGQQGFVAQQAQQELESPAQQESLRAEQQQVRQLPQQAGPLNSQPVTSWVVSGLFVSPPPYVLLQFEVRPDGSWVSPQVPRGQTGAPPGNLGVRSDVIKERAARLAELRRSVNLPQLLAALPDTPLPSLTTDGTDRIAQEGHPVEDPYGGEEDPFSFFDGNSANVAAKPTGKAPLNELSGKGGPPVPKSGAPLKISKVIDFEQRGERYQSATKQSLLNRQQRQYMNAPPDFAERSGPDAPSFDEQIGVSRPLWIGDRLILARRVGGNGETVVQGCWLDWPELKKQLLSEAAEQLPDANLVRVDGDFDKDPSRMLAGLPVRLVVGEVPTLGTASPTLGWALWIGWSATALAVLAAAALLHGVMRLSERRAAFVSSVTHELRTPLTTFRMYADMLARGMVPDAARRQEYFHTLQREAERLTLLVENVLAYARLERGRKPAAHDRVTLAKLMERIGPRLSQRAAQAEMKCDLRLDNRAANDEFTTDQAIVEQILFNLVDNAAKYARSADDRSIHVEGTRDAEWMRLVVRDHGPGIQQRTWTGRMKPFNKSAEESAETAPGVGLGLALCKRLARQLGGQLNVDGGSGEGTRVELLLPIA